MSTLDPRRHAYRPDLADARLRGRVTAERFVDGQLMRVAVPLLSVLAHGQPDQPLTTQALLGEDVLVFGESDGWAFIQLMRDGYVGYAERCALSADLAPITHQVTSLGTQIYTRATIKSAVRNSLPFGARLSGEVQDGFLQLARHGWIPEQHVVPVSQAATDYVAVALRMLGTPYLWGGKTAGGIDCSGLVQVSMHAAGFATPRDSDMQAAEAGSLLKPTAWHNLQRGDLICWRGHIGIMTDADNLLHANAHHMAVTLEPLAKVTDRATANDSDIETIRRPPGLTATSA